MVNKKAIIMATFVPSKYHIWVGVDIFNKIFEHFRDYDLYIGDNNSCVEWIEILEAYKNVFNLKYSITPQDKIIDSDASAFQTALALYKEESRNHDLVWFIHTKGVTSDSHAFRKELFNVFFKQKEEIETIMDNHIQLGLFSPYMYQIKGHDNYIENNLRCILKGDKFKDNINTNWSCFYAWYVMKGSILKEFLIDVDESFFQENLLTLGLEQKFDRYFFERDFPAIIEKYGFKFYEDKEYSWLKKFSK